MRFNLVIKLSELLSYCTNSLFFPLNDRDARDSAESGHYQSLKAEERYEHVYQGLLPTTNR